MNKSFKINHEEFEKLPKTSGLYYFYDKNDEILYIGKAKSLKSRITDHQWNYYFHKEGMFYRKYLISKGLLGSLREEKSKELQKVLDDFEIRSWSMPHMIVFDMIFDRTIRVETEEMEHKLTKAKEKEMILKFKPPFNYQTASDEYFQVQENME